MTDEKYNEVELEVIAKIHEFDSPPHFDSVGDDDDLIRKELVAEILKKHFPPTPAPHV